MQNHPSESPTSEELGAEVRRRTDQLEQLNLSLRRQLELAELLVPRLNLMLSQLRTIEYAGEVLITAGIIHMHPYEPGKGTSDSTLTFQAVLKIPGGIGALVIDSEELVEIRSCNPSDPEWPPRFFAPFAECPDGIKALILPKLPELLDRLFSGLSICGS